MNNKIINYPKELSKINIKESDRVVLVGGCFDIIHIGHLRFLEQAKYQGSLLIVILESDDFIIKHKKRQPLHNQNERADILASLTMIDYVVKIPYLTGYQQYLKLVTEINPDIIAVTAGDRQIANKSKQASAIGAKLTIVTPLIKNQSTTEILNKLGI